MKRIYVWPILLIAVGVLALCIMMLVWLARSREETALPVPPEAHRRIASNVLYTVSPRTAAEVLQIEAQEAEAARTVWAKEMLAQERGRTIERFWDAINVATNPATRWEVVAGFNAGEVLAPKWDEIQVKPHQIQLSKSTGAGRALRRAEWSELIQSLNSKGWLLDQVEFRHNQFDVTEQAGTVQPLKSRFYFSAHLKKAEKRVQVEGDIVIEWGEKTGAGEVEVKRVDASTLTIKRRDGEPAFKLARDEEIVPQGQSRILDPLILYDLDRDGLSEIILAGRNLVYRNRGAFKFEPEALCKFPEEFISTALVADFDGDGNTDFLCKKWEGLFLFQGSREGRFLEKPLTAWKPEKPLQKPMVITCGDIDADGDLDLFIGQYKEPYEGGATPRPFYDANDGEPAYLLLNDGSGQFHDGTAAAGLTSHRKRRTYSATFADLDHDGDLDLSVVSDFAGLDLYRNNGEGQFAEATQSWAGNNKAFGMAQCLSDFNNDGLIDLLMIGMTSPAAERLNHLELWRNDSPAERVMRQEMTHGNRLYLKTAAGKFAETELSASIARSGWSWGSTAFDFDNDRWVDVYIGNGLESNASVTEYESEYWLHDKYVGLTNAGTATDLYFKAKFSRTRARTHSYGGNERNRLYLNLQGKEFLEAGYLMGVALPEDSRNVVSDDLDGDGRSDLVLTTYEIWPRSKQTLKVFQNTNPGSGNWIGFRFESNGQSWPGTEVRLSHSGGETVRQLVTGDSFRSQHAPVVRFGLGSSTRADRVEIRSAGRPPVELRPQEINRILSVDE